MATSDVTTDLLSQVEHLRPLIKEHATSAEARRQLSRVVYDAMYDAGLFAMLAPTAHGGLELHPVEAMRVWETIARIDPSAAWNLVMNQAIAAYAAWLPAAGAHELFRDGPTTVAGALNPPAAATRVEGGWRITGQCPFGSGCHNAKWLAMPAVEMDGDHPKVDPATGQPVPFGVFLPRTAATILDTWHTFGMRGTGSTDYAVQDLFVPDRLTVPLLQAMADMPDEALQSHLAHLQAAEFLYETRLFPDHAYTFKHALTHEVAYSTLLQERRRVLHARIVEALERLTPDRMAEQVERLAHHALRGEVWGKAVTYCRQAGVKATDHSAYQEAVTYLEQALEALSHLPEDRDTHEQAIDLRLVLRTALRPSGDAGRILAYLREAESLAVALDDHHRLGQVSLFLSNSYRLMGMYDQALAAAQRAHSLATASGEVVLHAQANRLLGATYQAQGDYRRAIDCLRQTVAAFEGVRRRERFGQVHLPAVLSRSLLARYYAELGIFAEGRALGEEGLRIAEAVAHLSSLMHASHGIGLLSLRQGDLPRALPLLERAVGICHEADLPVYFPGIAAALGAAYTLAGRVADAVLLLTQAMAQTMTKEMIYEQVLCGLPLGKAQLLAGRLEEAHALAERALALTRERQERGHQAYALRLLGEIAARREPSGAEQATAHYRQALALAEELGMRPLQAHCHRGLGMLYATDGQQEQARAELATAIEMYRDMAMTFWLPETEVALAKVDA